MNKIPRLKRVFLYKWWIKMDDPKPKQELLQKVKEHTQACWDASPKSIPAPPVNPFVQIQQELRETYLDLSETELVIKSMDYMKQQFLQSMFSKDSSMKSTSSTQSEDDRTTVDPYEEDNAFIVLAGESQDPEEDPTEPNYGDIWDSVTEMIADKLLHDKSKVVKAKLKGHQKQITGLAFSQTLDILVSAGADAQLCIWDTEGWEKKKARPIQAPPGHPSPLIGETKVQFHNDQTHLLVVHESQIAVYDSQLGCLQSKQAEFTTYRCPERYPRDSLSAPISTAIYSCDGIVVFTGFLDGAIGVFDADNFRLRCWIAPSAYISSSPIASNKGSGFLVVIVAYPFEPNQIALGMSNGAVHVIEPSDAEPEWVGKHVRLAFNDWQNKIPRLKRVFLYKWWIKMDDPKPKQELLQKVKEHTQACWDASPKSIPAPPVNPFVQIQQELREKYLDLSETELVIKSMDYMKQQFLQSMFSKDSSMKSTSSTQSEDDRTTVDPYEEDNAFTVLAGESQDPEEDPTEPNYGDIWDLVTEMIADKLLHDKSKE
ncbi:unnamed protein product [Camellia sinensis]